MDFRGKVDGPADQMQGCRGYPKDTAYTRGAGWAGILAAHSHSTLPQSTVNGWPDETSEVGNRRSLLRIGSLALDDIPKVG